MPASPTMRTSVVQLDAVNLRDGAPHVLDQSLDVGGARGAVIDDEIGVLLAIPTRRRCENP